MSARSESGQIEGSVRKATAQDLPDIKSWLTTEEGDGFGFIHNWSSIERACAAGRMLVWSSPEGVDAFITEGVSINTILQVKTALQGCGIGRALVDCAIELEESANEAVLVVQCEPKSSVAFWTGMGFEPHRQRLERGWCDPLFMQRLSTRSHKEFYNLADQLAVVYVYPEAALFSSRHVIPDRVHYVTAWLDTSKRILHLSRRVSIANEQGLGDPVVEVTSGGMKLLQKTKAKHVAAQDAGFVRTPSGWGWYLDEFYLPDDMIDA